MKNYTITCSQDGVLSITCSIYRINELRKELTDIHGKAIVDTARQQLEDNGRVNLSEIGRRHNIRPTSVLAILRSRGYSKKISL